MKRLVVAPHSRRVEHVLRAVGLDEESMALVFTHGPSVDSVGPKNTVLVDSSDVVRAVSVAVSYAKSFERVRVVASESSSPNPVVASTLAFVALSSIEPYSGFVLEPFTLYHTGKTKELSGRLRLWVRGSRDYEILKALILGCLDVASVSELSSIPRESARRRLNLLFEGGFVEAFKSRRTKYCLTDFGRMLIG